MERAPKIEQNFKIAELNIVKPYMDKNFMISFDARDENQNKVYNRAIQEVCTEHELRPFHQIGSHKEVGYQAWEMWAKVTEETLQQLLPEIHVKAEEIYKKLKELGLISFDK